MADNRSRREKLEAMARQTASPHEAEVAKRKLAAMGHEPPKAAPKMSYADAKQAAWRQAAQQQTDAYARYEETLREQMRAYERAMYASYGVRFDWTTSNPSPDERPAGQVKPCIHGLAWEHCFTPPPYRGRTGRGDYQAPPDDDGGRPLGWNPQAHAEEPHWFAQWFGDQLRRQGADERDIENALSEMRRRRGWG